MQSFSKNIKFSFTCKLGGFENAKKMVKKHTALKLKLKFDIYFRNYRN